MRTTTTKCYPKFWHSGTGWLQFNVSPNADSKIWWWLSGAYIKWMLRWGDEWEGSKWSILEERCWKAQQMVAVMATEWNNESVESSWSSYQRRWNGLVQSLVDSHTNEWLSPKCGDRYQHIRVRWVQSKEQKLNKPHRREILCRDRFSMQITSEDTDDTDKLR